KKVLFAPEASADAVAITMQELRACRPETILNDVRAARAMDLTEQAGGLDVPTLVLAGSRDRLTTPALAERLSALIRGSRLRIVAGAGHLVPLEAPPRVNRPAVPPHQQGEGGIRSHVDRSTGAPSPVHLRGDGPRDPVARHRGDRDDAQRYLPGDRHPGRFGDLEL